VVPGERVAVYIPLALGQFMVNLNATSSKDAMQQAVEFFMTDWWKGPRTRVGMVLRIKFLYASRPDIRMCVTEELMDAARAKKRRPR
jgi:hypothetical protein